VFADAGASVDRQRCGTAVAAELRTPAGRVHGTGDASG
jgi:hypothetical protein